VAKVVFDLGPKKSQAGPFPTKLIHTPGLSELFRVGVCFDKVGGCAWGGGGLGSLKVIQIKWVYRLDNKPVSNTTQIIVYKYHYLNFRSSTENLL
jgi:hypothetical protein